MCAPGYQQGTMEESTERTRWIPCARASARAAIAPTHTLSTASNGTRARLAPQCDLLLFPRLTMNLEAGVPLFARRDGSIKQKQQAVVATFM